MPLPAAILDVTLRTMELRSPALVDRVALARDPYVLAFLGPRRIGRSRVIPAGATTFDFAPELARFAHRLRVDAGQAVRVEIQIWATDEASAPIATLVDQILPPWSSEERRVPGDLALTYDVEARRVPDPSTSGVAPRAAAGTTTQATLRLVDTAVVDIIRIRGLYEPNPGHAVGEHAARPRDGYRGEDDKGRIYLNRDLKGVFRKDLQLIELHAAVTMVRGSLPDGAKLRWRVSEPDDPTNDDPQMHPEAGIVVDRLDYDGFTGQQLGARGFDNEGKPDREPRWEAVPRFPLEIVTEAEAFTEVVGDESQVRIHCPNVAGDNLIVQVELVADTEVEVFGDTTGILSMWNRIDVEYVRMKSALSLPVADTARSFEPAFVQLDFTAPRTVPDVPFVGDTELSNNRRVALFVESYFRHAGQPGWFLTISALRAYPNTRPKSPLYEGPVTIEDRRVVERGVERPLQLITIPGDHPDAYKITLEWLDTNHGPEARRTVTFQSSQRRVTKGPSGIPGQRVTECQLDPHDYAPLFVANDNGPWIFFLPNYQFDGTSWKKGGYSVSPGEIQATVESESAYPTWGQSMAKWVGNKVFATGRTIIYTGEALNPDTGSLEPGGLEKLQNTLTHELAHAFDFPHKCGNWDYRTERATSCTMNYAIQWLLDFELPMPTRLLPDTSFHLGIELCARHLKELRRTHLEDNPALRWK
jgi:hypothetical protein